MKVCHLSKFVTILTLCQVCYSTIYTSGSGSGSGDLSPEFVGCPMDTLTRPVLLDSSVLTVSVLDLEEEEDGIFSDAIITYTSTPMISSPLMFSTENDTLSLTLLQSDLPSSGTLVVFVTIVIRELGVPVDTCTFNVSVTGFEEDICVNPGPQSSPDLLLIDNSVRITVDGSMASITSAVLSRVRASLAFGLSLGCPDTCELCGLTSMCDVYFELCANPFETGNVMVLSVTAASADTTTITVAVRYPPNFPLLDASSTAVDPDTLMEILLGNTGAFAAATGLNIVDVEVNDDIPGVTDIFDAIAPILLPIVVTIAVVTMIAGIATTVGISQYRKHKKQKSRIKPQDDKD